MLLAKELSKTHRVAYIDLDISSSSYSEFSGNSFKENFMQISDGGKILPFIWVHNTEANPIEVICTSMLVGSVKSVVGESMSQFVADIINHSELTAEYVIFDAPAGLGSIWQITFSNKRIRRVSRRTTKTI